MEGGERDRQIDRERERARGIRDRGREGRAMEKEGDM